MGVGAAFVMPSTLSILTNVFPRREQAKAIAIWAGISGSGAAIGPLASGLLLEHFWWGSVFLVNLPIIAAPSLPGYVLVPKSKDPRRRRSTPSARCCRSSASARSCTPSSRRPTTVGPASSRCCGSVAPPSCSCCSCVWEWRNRHPMLDLRLFQNPRFAVSSGGITLVFFAMFGTFFLLAQYLQGVIGYTPARGRRAPAAVLGRDDGRRPATRRSSSAASAPIVVGIGRDAAGRRSASRRRRCSRPTPTTPQLALTMCVLAGGMALTMTPMTTQLMAAVPATAPGWARRRTTRPASSAARSVSPCSDRCSPASTRRASIGRRPVAGPGPRDRRGRASAASSG